jgi:hypothetical protein
MYHYWFVINLWRRLVCATLLLLSLRALLQAGNKATKHPFGIAVYVLIHFLNNLSNTSVVIAKCSVFFGGGVNVSLENFSTIIAPLNSNII